MPPGEKCRLAQEGALPNLVGTWKGERTTNFKEGQIQTTEELRITEQNGAYFRATKTWEHVEKDSKPMGHVGERGVGQASEPMLGVIDFDGETIYYGRAWGLGSISNGRYLA